MVQPVEKEGIHPTAVIDNGTHIGKGTRIWHHAHVIHGSNIGEDCVLGQNVCVGPDVKIGHRCKIQNNVSVYTAVTLEDEVFCGPSCVFTNVINPRAFLERKDEFKPTLIRRGATIGANATILCGVTVGRFAMIGAGAVVLEDVMDYALMVGVPARKVGWVCKCGTTLTTDIESLRCRSCGNTYLLDGKLHPIRET